MKPKHMEQTVDFGFFGGDSMVGHVSASSQRKGGQITGGVAVWRCATAGKGGTTNEAPVLRDRN